MLAGVVGKPNVGKSTFFSAATLVSVAISPRPFTTIKPNRGIGYLRTPCVCRDLNVSDTPTNSICVDGVRMIPVEIIDCAGLVPGAWKGRGLGNKFLDDIRQADALIHVVDAAGATDAEGQPCEPGIRDPLEDCEFLDFEFSMWLAEIMRKDWRRLSQTVETLKESLVDLVLSRLTGLAVRREHITKALDGVGLDVSKPSRWSDDDFQRLASGLMRASKPMVIAANKIDLPYAKENVDRMVQKGYRVVPCSAEAELVLRRATEKGLISYKPGDPDFRVLNSGALSEGQRRALNFIEENVLRVWGDTGVQNAINTAYRELLNMIVVYPVEDETKLSDHHGRVLPGAYLVSKGTTARELAYRIHSDLGDGFIYAVDARTKKRLGDDYVLNDRDVVRIVSVRGRP